MTAPAAAAQPLPQPKPLSPKRSRLVTLIAAGLVLVAAIAVLLLHWRRHHVESAERSKAEAEQARGPRISVTQVKTTAAHRVVTLPGDVHGFNQVTLYAKLSGYVRQVNVERGDRVESGQVLALLESPESQRDVASAQHDALLTRRNAARAEALAPSGMVTQQDRDTAFFQAKISHANLSRARDILDYTSVRAPFDGMITARYVDPGALVPAATGGTQAAMPIVDLADVDHLRVFVYVGQDVAPFVRLGDHVTIWQDELPAKRVPGTVTRIAGALDPRTRTMQVEVDLDNRTWKLLPGTFAHVEVQIAEPRSPLIPDEAIVIRDGKTMVAEIKDSRAHYQPVTLGYNDGQGVRVLSGLSGGETIGIDVPVEIAEGAPVQPMKMEAGKGKGQGAGGGQANGAGANATGNGNPASVGGDGGTDSDGSVKADAGARDGGEG
jgi:membrane fusion protein, multidrug efflux system